MRYEFKVIPAPRRGEKARGVKTTEERFALALTNVMNTMGAEGWDYVRADTLPVDERAGLTGTKTSYQNMLVFRRVIDSAVVTGPLAGDQGGSEAAMTRLQPAERAPRLGAATDVAEGAAPSLGPANGTTPGIAAE